MEKNQHINAQGVYSDYSFITTAGTPRWIMSLYEDVRNLIYFIKIRHKVHLLVRGFSFGIVRQKGLENGAFTMGKQRAGKGIYGTDELLLEAKMVTWHTQLSIMEVKCCRQKVNRLVYGHRIGGLSTMVDLKKL